MRMRHPRVTPVRCPFVLDELLATALATGDDGPLQHTLLSGSGLPGPRLNLRLVWSFAGAVGDQLERPDPPGAALESLLDRWAALPLSDAPVTSPAVILPCAAVASYGEAGAVREDWFSDEIAKLRLAASDPRWRVREVVAQALQRMLDAHWGRTAGALLDWASTGDALVVRAAVAAVAEPRLLRDPERARAALELQYRGVARFRAMTDDPDRRILGQALGFTISIAAAAAGDMALLEELAASSDADLRRIAAQNLDEARLKRLR
jgi:hypothetical protein